MKNRHKLASAALILAASHLAAADAEQHPANADPQQQELSEIKQENQGLRKRLAELEKFKQAEMAENVFNASKDLLFRWISFGGLALTISGVIGIKALKDYLAELIKKKLESISLEEIQKNLEEESKARIIEITSRQTEELDTYAKRRIEQILLANTSIKSISVQSAPHTESRVDYTQDIPYIRDTGTEGAVVGHALATALEYQIYKQTGARHRVSARHIYYIARQGKLPLNQDSGALIKDAINALVTKGTVEEDVWPYRSGEFGKKPPAGVTKAGKFKIAEPALLGNLEEIKRALQNNGPVVLGIPVYSSLYANDSAPTIFPMPKNKDQLLGQTAICMVGYDDTTKLMKFANCWGDEWGENGFGYIPYEYVERYAQDAWSFKYDA